MEYFRIFNSMANDMIIAATYLNYKTLKLELVLRQMAFIFSNYFDVFWNEFSIYVFVFSDFDLKRLPMTYNINNLERKFSFHYTPNDLYSPYVSQMFKNNTSVDLKS